MGSSATLNIAHFTMEPDFQSSKRFKRYVTKTRITLVEFITKAFPSWADVYSSDPLTNWTVLIYTAAYRHNAFDPRVLKHPEIRKTNEILTNWALALHHPVYKDYNLLAYLDEKDTEFINNLFIDAQEELRLLIDKELTEVCTEWIRENEIANPSKFDEGNYHRTIPETSEQFVLFLWKYANSVFADIDRMLLDVHMATITSRIDQSYQDLFIEEINTLKDKVFHLEEENETLQLTRDLLVAKLEKQEAIPKTVIKEVNSKGLAPLQKKYDDLEQKYKRLQTELALLKETPTTETTASTITVDHTKTYAFLMDTDTVPIMQQKLLGRFPNAIFLRGENGIATLEPTKIDAVICLNKFINHSTYYGYKERCKTQNIPFIHCNYKDIDLIEREIGENLNDKT